MESVRYDQTGRAHPGDSTASRGGKRHGQGTRGAGAACAEWQAKGKICGRACAALIRSAGERAIRHEKGALQARKKRRHRRFEQANGGRSSDETARFDAADQVKLLRVCSARAGVRAGAVNTSHQGGYPPGGGRRTRSARWGVKGYSATTCSSGPRGDAGNSPASGPAGGHSLLFGLSSNLPKRTTKRSPRL